MSVKDKWPVVDLDALRGAYVTLYGQANDLMGRAAEHREEARRLELASKDHMDMARAASAAYVALGGDPALADNWYSWTYLGTNERKRDASVRGS